MPVSNYDDAILSASIYGKLYLDQILIEKRCQRYFHKRKRLALSEEVVAETMACLQQQRAIGMDRFRARVEAELQRFVSVRPLHRSGESMLGVNS